MIRSPRSVSGTLLIVVAAQALVIGQESPRAVAGGTRGDEAEHGAKDDAKVDKPCCEPAPATAGSAPLPMDRKSVLLRDLAVKLRDSTAPFVGEGLLPELERRVAAAAREGNPAQIFPLRSAIGDNRLQLGDIEGAIADYGACRDIAVRSKDLKPRVVILRKLALAWLRLAERQNCISNHNQDSCLLPLKDGAIHQERKGGENAILCLTEILKADTGDLQAMWLLNLAHMTLGTWPVGVPPLWRIPVDAFASEHPMRRMPDIAPKLGVNAKTRAGGSIMDDFDGDGRLDLVTSSMDPFEPLRMFRQQPDGTFKDVAAQVGLHGQLGGLQLIHFDANNDGRLDLLVQRGAWLNEFGCIPNSLLIQQPDGTFVDRTQEAGVEVALPSQVAAVADIDNDGDLDLFLGAETNPAHAHTNQPSHLFRNKGDGTFEDITATAGVQNGGYCKGAAFGDYDGDRLPDLYVSNLHGANRLYRNRGDGRFTDVGLDLAVHAPFDSFSCLMFDYNNDGWLDIWVACYSSSVQRTAEICSFYKNGTTGTDVQRLYENDGHGNFRNVTRARGLDRAAFPMGSNFGDVDNDGWPDLYVATGDPEFTSLWPNVMYRNDQGRRFQDVTTATGTGHLQKGHGVSFGDLDRDGDQDLFVQMGGAVKDDAFHDVLFENPGYGNHWLTVNVIGHQTNRFGVGVRLKATIDEPTGARDVYGFVGTNSSFGGNSFQQELGLGQANRILRFEVFWPTTGRTDTFTDVPLDTAIIIEEGVGWRSLTPGRVSSS